MRASSFTNPSPNVTCARCSLSVAIAAAACLWLPVAGAQQPRPRARDLGIKIGVLSPGPLNAITDVDGVQVGHCSITRGDDIRTGVTAILPHRGNLFQTKVPAAVHVANGFGKFVGSTQVNELGVLETPILLTNTLSTFAVADAVVAWSIRQPGNAEVRSVNPVVGECNDGFLNDIRGQHVDGEDVVKAITDAGGGPVEEGCVGAGVGTRCLGWKGGIGTASRKLPRQLGGSTVGVLVQTNFTGQLTIAGAPVGRELGRFFLRDAVVQQEHGSCIVIIATDAALDARQLRRLAKRATLGLAAVGSPLTHGSGDYTVAFSTHPSLRAKYQDPEPLRQQVVLQDDRISPLFQAVREATEEAVVNSLLKATTTSGRSGHTVEAISPDDVVRICRKFGVIADEQESPKPRIGIESADQCIAKIRQRLPILQRDLHVPGVSIALIDDGQLVWSEGFGVRCQGRESLMRSDTVMEACSMSKPFFAYMVMKLVERGEFDLDRPLVDYLGRDYLTDDAAHREITASMVMAHTTGLPNWRKGGWRAGGPVRIRFKPGTQFGYSGEGFLMLQRAVEELTGKTLDSWSRSQLIGPLRLQHTSYQWNDSLAEDSACGHDASGDLKQNRSYYDRPCAAFSLYTSADDYARFLIEILSPDDQSPNDQAPHSLSAALKQQMIEPASYRTDQGVSWGLGWGLKEVGGHRMVYHSGSNGSGFRCYCEFWPHSRDGIVIMTNAVGGKELWQTLIAEIP